MTFKNRCNLVAGRFAQAIKSRFVRGPGRHARTATHRAYGHSDLQRCPGAYALLAGVPRR